MWGILTRGYFRTSVENSSIRRNTILSANDDVTLARIALLWGYVSPEIIDVRRRGERASTAYALSDTPLSRTPQSEDFTVTNKRFFISPHNAFFVKKS